MQGSKSIYQITTIIFTSVLAVQSFIFHFMHWHMTGILLLIALLSSLLSLSIFKIFDITISSKNQNALKELSLLPQQNISPVLRATKKGFLLFSNEAAKPLLKHWNAENTDRLPDEIHQLVRRAYIDKKPLSHEVTLDDQWFLLEFIPIPKKEYINIYASDITSLKHYQNELSHLSHSDALTGLDNRNTFIDRIAQSIEWSQKNHKLFMVYVISLANFSEIQHIDGFNRGDEILISISHSLKSLHIPNSTIARISEAEFAIIIEDFETIDDLYPAIENLQSSLKQLELPENLKLHSGITVFPEDNASSPDLVSHASLAAKYSQKQKGFAYQFYIAEMNHELQARHALLTKIKETVDRDGFEFHYQPFFHLKDQSLAGAEALLRWKKEEGTYYPTSDYIDLLEESHLLIRMTDQMLRTVCNTAKALNHNRIPPIVVSMNVSADQFAQDNFVDIVKKHIDQSGISPEWLKLELTERVLVQQKETMQSHLNTLYNMGVKIAIDDFGTGYSSLAYLKTLPVTHLKIDRSFIFDIAENAKSRDIVSAIISLGHSLHLSVIAEGIETAAQFDILRSLHCDIMQGFYLARPCPLDKFTKLFF